MDTSNIVNTPNVNETPAPPKSKRGRKPKNCILNTSTENVVTEPIVPKKRGRKPKGGKIIPQNIVSNNINVPTPSIILHLKCSMKDLELESHTSELLTNTNLLNYANEITYEVINKPIDIEPEVNEPDNFEQQSIIDDTKEYNKTISKKLKELEKMLHFNNIEQPKSACFWCSYDFDNPPVYIPKHFIKNFYNVYGCFCSPECATGYLMKENIDSSVKFERYSLINNLYGKIYEYSKNIKPAPDPYYLLDKYYGNLNIKEYRKMLQSDRLFLVIDKPISKILPEIHEDNEDFIINNKIIPSSNYQIKKRLQKNQTKNNIVNEHFGMNKY